LLRVGEKKFRKAFMEEHGGTVLLTKFRKIGEKLKLEKTYLIANIIDLTTF